MCLKSQGLSYNLEFIESLQVRNLLYILELIATAALTRQESRGLHYRSDYPHVDNDNWLRNTILSRGMNGINVSTSPVVSTKIRLPKGLVPFDQYARERSSHSFIY